MAEANVTPQGTANTPPNGTGNTPAGSQPQEPAWLTSVPEQHREDARKGYLLQSEFTRKSQDFSEKQKAWDTERSDLQKRVDEYNQFAQQYQPFYARLQQHWDRIGPILEGREQTPASQPTPQQNVFENWEELAPQEQARRLADYNGVSFAQQIQQLKQEFNQALAAREQYYGNYLGILTDAFERARKDPSLNLPEYMQKAIAIQYGRENPLELAYASVTSERTRKQLEEDAYNRGRADREQEYKNAQHTNGALQSQTIPVFRQKPLTRDQVTEAARKTAIDKGLPW